MKKVTTKSAREFLNAVKLPSPTRGVVECLFLSPEQKWDTEISAQVATARSSHAG